VLAFCNDAEIRHKIVSEVVETAVKLAPDPFGNYVVQVKSKIIIILIHVLAQDRVGDDELMMLTTATNCCSMLWRTERPLRGRRL
jgi:hypothetical protein